MVVIIEHLIVLTTSRKDIEQCQKKGKTIILSIGGATYSEGGFDSESDAKDGAKLMWETFGPKQSGSKAKRPFDDAVIDGFDFDFEAHVTHMAPFANELRSLMDKDDSKQYYLTAAPQCVYPDAADKEFLNDEPVSIDAIWVQFYNNGCGVNNFNKNSKSSQYNFEEWDNWAKTVSKNKDVKVLVGVPGDTTGASTGYIPINKLNEVIEYSKKFESFGGVMMWDATQAFNNKGYIDGVRKTLGEGSPKPHSDSGSSPSSSASSTASAPSSTNSPHTSVSSNAPGFSSSSSSSSGSGPSSSTLENAEPSSTSTSTTTTVPAPTTTAAQTTKPTSTAEPAQPTEPTAAPQTAESTTAAQPTQPTTTPEPPKPSTTLATSSTSSAAQESAKPDSQDDDSDQDDDNNDSSAADDATKPSDKDPGSSKSKDPLSSLLSGDLLGLLGGLRQANSVPGDATRKLRRGNRIEA